MYHISKDKRSAQSAELIYQGLLSCMKIKPFEEITITDIQKASSVARTTFYRCFDNLADVLYWRCDLCFQEVLGGFTPTQFQNEQELAHHYFSYWMTHGDILAMLIHINRQDIIYSCHMKNAKDLEKIYGVLPGMDAKNAKYFMAIRTGITISVLKVWLDDGQKETAEELLQIIKNQFSFLSKSFSG